MTRKSVSRRLLLVALVMSHASVASALEHYASIRISSIARIAQISSQLTDAGIVPGGLEQVQGTLDSFAGVIDTTRPCGALVVGSQSTADFVFFVPIENSQELLPKLLERGMDAEQDELGGIRVRQGREYYLLPNAQWCYIASSKEQAQGLPGSPLQWTRDLGSSASDLVVSINVQNIPGAMKASSLERVGRWFSGSDIDNGFSRILPEFTTRGLLGQELLRAIGDSDRCQFAFTVTDQSGLECELAFEGRRVRRSFAKDSTLTGVHLPHATIAGSYRTLLSDEQVAWIDRWIGLVLIGFQSQAKSTSIEQNDGENLIVELLREASNVTRELATRGDVDVAFVRTGAGAEANQAFGIQLGNAQRVMNRFVPLVQQIQEVGGPVRNMETLSSGVADTQLYTLSVPGDVLNQDDLETWVKLAVVSTPDAVWIAQGTQPTTLLKEILQQYQAATGPVTLKWQWTPTTRQDGNDDRPLVGTQPNDTALAKVSSEYTNAGVVVRLKFNAQAVPFLFGVAQ
jgi:hypothetical protein